MAFTRFFLRFCLWVFVFVFSGLLTFAQQVIQTGDIHRMAYQDYAYQSKTMHSSIQPFRMSDVPFQITDSIEKSIGFPPTLYREVDWLLNKPFYKAPFTKSVLEINPIVGFTTGWGSKAFIPSELALGMDVTFLYKKLTVSASPTAFIGKYPNYINQYTRQFFTLPGIGFAYNRGNSIAAINPAAFVNYRFSNFFSAEIGNGKHFIGDGYRSLFLSQHAPNYNYLSLDVSFWKIRYKTILSSLSDIASSKQGVSIARTGKYAATHYLDVKIGNRAAIGFFETVIWTHRNADGSVRGLDFHYLNPAIFFRPVEYSLGSSDNVLLGANAHIRLWKNWIFYGQIMLDEFFFKEIRAWNGWWANKQGVQAGVKVFDLARVKGLFAQAEANYVRPYSYTHFRVEQNYGHFGQPLAHPLGANFAEVLGRVVYQRKRAAFQAKLLGAVYGTDSAQVNFGSNINLPYTNRPFEYGNRVGQGIRTWLWRMDVQYSYLINRKWNLRAEACLTIRQTRHPSAEQLNTSERFITVGIRTNLPERVWDF